jgi:hypothetical protein
VVVGGGAVVVVVGAGAGGVVEVGRAARVVVVVAAAAALPLVRPDGEADTWLGVDVVVDEVTVGRTGAPATSVLGAGGVVVVVSTFSAPVGLAFASITGTAPPSTRCTAIRTAAPTVVAAAVVTLSQSRPGRKRRTS